MRLRHWRSWSSGGPRTAIPRTCPLAAVCIFSALLSNYCLLGTFAGSLFCYCQWSRPSTHLTDSYTTLTAGHLACFLHGLICVLLCRLFSTTTDRGAGVRLYGGVFPHQGPPRWHRLPVVCQTRSRPYSGTTRLNFREKNVFLKDYRALWSRGNTVLLLCITIMLLRPVYWHHCTYTVCLYAPAHVVLHHPRRVCLSVLLTPSHISFTQLDRTTRSNYRYFISVSRRRSRLTPRTLPCCVVDGWRLLPHDCGVVCGKRQGCCPGPQRLHR